MSKRLLVILAALAPLAAFGACTGDDTIVDGGSDAAKDATTKDVKNDVAADVANDAKLDTSVDVGTDAKTDAETDAAPDSAADSAADSATDADTDAATDAADAAADGGSMWNSPTCDGTISAGEYGGASNQTTSGTQTWYMTWDATYLYVGLTVADVTQPTVIYVGFSGGGVQNGQTYDGTGGTLSFLADGVVYAKHGYNEVRTPDADAGTWPNQTTSAITFCDDGQTTREEKIPWSALGSTSIPSAFRFIGYAIGSNAFVYGQIPTSNPGGTIGTSANFAHDFYVTSTDNGNGSFPFDLTE